MSSPSVFRRSRLPVLLAAIALCWAALPGAATAVAPPDQARLGWLMPDLAATLPLGLSAGGIWHGAIDSDAAGRGHYLLNNTGSAASIYYGYLLQRPDSSDSLAVDIDLPSAAATRLSGAGLLFDFDPDGTRYCAFVLHPDGVAGLYLRDEAGLHALAQARPAVFHGSGSNRLRLHRDGQAVTAFVNGDEAIRLEAPAECGADRPATATETATAAAGYEGTGIIALSLGRFGFRNLTLH